MGLILLFKVTAVKLATSHWTTAGLYYGDIHTKPIFVHHFLTSGIVTLGELTTSLGHGFTRCACSLCIVRSHLLCRITLSRKEIWLILRPVRISWTKISWLLHCHWAAMVRSCTCYEVKKWNKFPAEKHLFGGCHAHAFECPYLMSQRRWEWPGRCWLLPNKI